MYDNFVCHKTLRATRAMAPGMIKRLWEIGDMRLPWPNPKAVGITPIMLKSPKTLVILLAIVCVPSNLEARQWRHYWDSGRSTQYAGNKDQRAPGTAFGTTLEQWIRGCNQEALELEKWSFESVAQIAGVDDAQRSALAQMQSTADKIGESLASTCPSNIPAPLTARFDALDQVLGSFVAALDAVRPPIEAFYGSLNDEQKARLVAIYMSQDSSQENSNQDRRSTRNPRTALNVRTMQRDLICQQWAGSLRSWPIRQIESGMPLSDDQRAALYVLTGSIYRAAGTLIASCLTESSFTPLGQLDAKRKRVDALRQAINLIRPPLGQFTDTLTDEQKMRLVSAVNAAQIKPQRRRSSDDDD
jgi:hypothetical protein